MRIAAMAAGAVGGYFGARLAAAGHDVFFIARGAHRDAIAKNGLKVESVHGDLHLPKPNVTDDPAKVGPVDIVLFAVKLWDTESAAEAARPLLGPGSLLITFQNGIDSVDRLSAALGSDRVVGGAAYIATVIASPGVIKHTSQFATLRFGRADKKPDPKLSAFVEAGKAKQYQSVRRHIARALAKFISSRRWQARRRVCAPQSLPSSRIPRCANFSTRSWKNLLRSEKQRVSHSIMLISTSG
jgi:2-dehydropantoate 2-reductase